jgi:uncharacterized protein (TIGR00299 family) protein
VTVLYFDCFSGASGDMVLGALIDAGVPLPEVRAALGSLALTTADRNGDLVWTERVTRAGLAATKFCVAGEDPPAAAQAGDLTRETAAATAGSRASHGHTAAHDHVLAGDGAHEHSHDVPHGHSHDGAHHHASRHALGQAPDPHTHTEAHDHPRAQAAAPGPARGHFHTHGGHGHHTLHEIHHLIDQSALSTRGKGRAKQLFVRLGEAEAAVHGIPIDDVHLHEVGALDSIIDIVGAVFALEWLAVDRIVASPLNVGSGSIHSAHGVYPVPAPATAHLVQGVPVYTGSQQAELLTPTGALLVTSYAAAYGPLPAMRVQQIGYGAGRRDFPQTPNVLRVLIGDTEASIDEQDVVVLESEIDDMSPQVFGVLMDRLLAEGALDVFYTPVQMKKNRPGTLLSVVAPPGLRERLGATIFRETTTIGLRYREMRRMCLDRDVVTVQTAFGDVRVKVSRLGSAIVTASPEFDDCVRAANDYGRPFKEVHAAAAQAFAQRPIDVATPSPSVSRTPPSPQR